MYTIRELSNKSGLSRTALLYYESIGLLAPEARSESNYRLYGEDSLKRLDRICMYRDAGVPLSEIGQILSYEHDVEREVLERTLSMLNQKAQEIKESQEKISAMLHQEVIPLISLSGSQIKSFIDILEPLGIDEGVYLQFHEILEDSSPESHRAFLDFCGFAEKDITRILEQIHKKRKVVIDDV